MPDGDRLEKTLHGKWWRKTYRQACAGDSFQMLGDTLMKAAADALRHQLACTALAKIRNAVYQALKEKARGGQLNFGDQPLADSFRMLTDLLSDIVSEEDMSLSTQLAAKVARSVYLELQRDCRTVSAPQIQERLSETFGWQVIRNQYLAKGRKGIMLQSVASELGARAGGDERQVRHSVLQLYRRYAAEWERFSARERLGVRARAA